MNSEIYADELLEEDSLAHQITNPLKPYNNRNASKRENSWTQKETRSKQQSTTSKKQETEFAIISWKGI